jgi:hypothetical protein
MTIQRFSEKSFLALVAGEAKNTVAETAQEES